MSKRRRRTTHLQVETLDGRAVPSIVITYAVVDLTREKFAQIHGLTTSPSKPGQDIEIRATEHWPHDPKTIHAIHPNYTEIYTTSKGYSGIFVAYVEAPGNQHWIPGATLSVIAFNITSRAHPHTIDRSNIENLLLRAY
jgi:hypothetical protein